MSDRADNPTREDREGQVRCSSLEDVRASVVGAFKSLAIAMVGGFRTVSTRNPQRIVTTTAAQAVNREGDMAQYQTAETDQLRALDLEIEQRLERARDELKRRRHYAPYLHDAVRSCYNAGAIAEACELMTEAAYMQRMGREVINAQSVNNQAMSDLERRIKLLRSGS